LLSCCLNFFRYQRRSTAGGYKNKKNNARLALSIKKASERELGDETMATDKNQNLQDVFLNHLRKAKMPVTVFLVNGVKLQGIITWFDNFCVLLRRDAHSQLVYKHAISTVMPSQPVQLFDPTSGDDAGDEDED